MPADISAGLDPARYGDDLRQTIKDAAERIINTAGDIAKESEPHRLAKHEEERAEEKATQEARREKNKRNREERLKKSSGVARVDGSYRNWT